MDTRLVRPVLPGLPDAASVGVHTSVGELVRLRYEAHGFALKSTQPWRSLLQGRYASRIKGRGADFAELRGYLPGDDLRTIDWRVTARTGKPHVRVFHEERERPVLIVLDQRIGMFFGTRRAMKSVAAAEAAALAAWRVHADGDRVGALLFNDRDIESIRPAPGEAHVLHMLGRIAARDAELRADTALAPNSSMLDAALERAATLAAHGHLIVVITDFHGIGDRTRELVLGLEQRNDVVVALVYDRLALDPPRDRSLRVGVGVGAGSQRMEWDFSRRQFRETVALFARSRQDDIRAWERSLAVPVIALATDTPVAVQVREALGAMPAAGGRR